MLDGRGGVEEQEDSFEFEGIGRQTDAVYEAVSRRALTVELLR